MNKSNNKLKLAIQSKWRLNNYSIKFLNWLWIRFNTNWRTLIKSCDNFDLDILYLRSNDIPEYVSKWIADFGIVGENVIYEKKSPVNKVQKLWFWKCKLVIAVPKKSKINTLDDLNWKRIATSYPEILKIFLDGKNIKTEIIKISWSCEIAPNLNLSDAICDLTQTWNSFDKSIKKVLVLCEIINSEAYLIESPFIKPTKFNFKKLCKL